MLPIAKTPTPPYFSVIFTSIKTENHIGHGEMVKRMVELAAQQPVFLGIESAREDVGITVSYWADLESIRSWKTNSEHLYAKKTIERIGTIHLGFMYLKWSVITACKFFNRKVMGLVIFTLFKIFTNNRLLFAGQYR